MGDAVFRHESAVEYFKEMVDGALAHQGLATQELTAFYVVQLLTSFLQRPILGERVDEAPLALRLAKAFEGSGAEQRASLRQIATSRCSSPGSFPIPSVASSSMWITTSASAAARTTR